MSKMAESTKETHKTSYGLNCKRGDDGHRRKGVYNEKHFAGGLYGREIAES